VILWRALILTVTMAAAARAQGIIDFESGGLKYKAMTRAASPSCFSAASANTGLRRSADGGFQWRVGFLDYRAGGLHVPEA